MRLIQLLLEASKKDIIINKIGLHKDVADELISNYGKKRALLYANIFKDWYSVYLKHHGASTVKYGDIREIHNDIKQIFDGLDGFLSSNNKPKDLFKLIKKTKVVNEGEPKFKISDNTYTEDELLDNLNSLRDYLNAVDPTPQISDMSTLDAFEEAEDWHNSREASGSSIELEEGQEIVHKFDDGYYWVDLGTSDCSDEADAMGHCGSTSADTLLSLRDPKHIPHVTVAFNYDGSYQQMKGKGNKKPVQKYDEYCQWLFTNGGDYQLKEYKPEYRGENDFKVEDLPDDVRMDVVDEYPALEGFNVDKLDDLYTEEGEEAAVEYFNEALESNIEGFHDSIEQVVLERHIFDSDDLGSAMWELDEYNLANVSDELDDLAKIAKYVDTDGDRIYTAILKQYDKLNPEELEDYTEWEIIFKNYCEYLLNEEQDKFKQLLINIDGKHGGYVRDFINNSGEVKPSMKLFIMDFIAEKNPKDIRKAIEDIINKGDLEEIIQFGDNEEKIVLCMILPIFSMTGFNPWKILEGNKIQLDHVEYQDYMYDYDLLKSVFSRMNLSETMYQHYQNLDDYGFENESYTRYFKMEENRLLKLFDREIYEKAFKLAEFILDNDKSIEDLSYIEGSVDKDLFGNWSRFKPEQYRKITYALDKLGYFN